jgi:hypothetical protein
LKHEVQSATPPSNAVREWYAGTYIRHTEKGNRMTLTLRADGTFTEKWDSGQLDGTWKEHEDGWIVGTGDGFDFARHYRVFVKLAIGSNERAYRGIADEVY